MEYSITRLSISNLLLSVAKTCVTRHTSVRKPSAFFCMRRNMLRKPLLRDGVRLADRPRASITLDASTDTISSASQPLKPFTSSAARPWTKGDMCHIEHMQSRGRDEKRVSVTQQRAANVNRGPKA